jgi:hypothetical protein
MQFSRKEKRKIKLALLSAFQPSHWLVEICIPNALVVIIFDLKERPFLRASVHIMGVTSQKADDLWSKDAILGKVIFRPTLDEGPIS